MKKINSEQKYRLDDKIIDHYQKSKFSNMNEFILDAIEKANEETRFQTLAEPLRYFASQQKEANNIVRNQAMEFALLTYQIEQLTKLNKDLLDQQNLLIKTINGIKEDWLWVQQFKQ